MSVLIRGMEMPVMCSYCKFREPFIDYAYCHLAEMDMEYEESDNCRHPNCPLVEISAPHGDLVDRNELLAEYDRQHEGEAGKARKIMEQAKTVIEAEGSET